jgi:hypothetical protein
MLELIFQLFAELLIQLASHATAELIGRGAFEVFRRPHPLNAWLAAVGYLVWGAACGLLSLLIWPNAVITAQPWRVVNLFLTPALVGCLAVLWGRWSSGHGLSAARVNTLLFGFLFALSVALIRYVGAH